MKSVDAFAAKTYAMNVTESVIGCSVSGTCVLPGERRDEPQAPLAPPRKICVAGGNGFIGSHLARRLKSLGHTVVIVDWRPCEFFEERELCDHFVHVDLRCAEACRRAVQGCEWVFHLAADMGGMGFIGVNHAAVMFNSTLVTLHLLEACRREKVRRLFFASSACVYPESIQSGERTQVQGLRESDAWPAKPQDAYGLEKLYGEELCLNFAKDYGIEVRIARFHNVYGPQGTWCGGREKAPAAFCRKIAAAEDGGEVEVWGDGEQARSFLFVEDCVEGILRLMKSDVTTPVNLGSDELVTVNELVALVSAVAGKKVNRRAHPGPQGVRGRNSDNSLVRRLLGWEPTVSLREGLAHTYPWVAAQVARSHRSVAELRSSHLSSIIVPSELGRVEHPAEKVPHALVVVLAEARSHELTYQRFQRHVLAALGADLAVCVGDRIEPTNPFLERATYRWLFPEVADWARAYDEAARCEGVPPGAWRVAVRGIRNQLFGGILDSKNQHPGSAGILLFFRWFLMRQLERESLLRPDSPYSHIIVTRSDHYWLCDHPPLAALNDDRVWIPEGCTWGGVTDRHSVVPVRLARAALDLLQPVLHTPKDLVARMAHKGTWNLEQYIAAQWEWNGVPYSFFPRVMYCVRSESARSRWAWGTYDPARGMVIKYRSEMAQAEQRAPTLRNSKDWLQALAGAPLGGYTNPWCDHSIYERITFKAAELSNRIRCLFRRRK